MSFLSSGQLREGGGEDFKAAQTGLNWLWLDWALCLILCPKRSLFPVFLQLAADTPASWCMDGGREAFIILGCRIVLSSWCKREMRMRFTSKAQLQGCRAPQGRTAGSPLMWDWNCVSPADLWGINSVISLFNQFSDYLLWLYLCTKYQYSSLCPQAV